jgi:NYN domain-containing protein
LSKAVVLIDWDNLKITMLTKRLWSSTKQIIEQISDAAKKNLEARKIPLLAIEVFAPSSSYTGEDRRILDDLHVQAIVVGGAGKNAADLALAIRAVRLSYDEGYDTFIVVSGDVDYLPLARDIEHHQQSFQLWAVSPDCVSGAVRDYKGTRYLTDLIKVTPGRAPSADDVQLFLLLCHRVVMDGTFGGDGRLLRLLGELNRMPEAKLQPALNQAKDRGYFLEKDNRRRLRYESTQVGSLFERCDIALEYIRDSRGQTATLGHTLEFLQRNGVNDAEAARLCSALSQAGYLSQVGTDYFLEFPLAGFGTARALSRLALIVQNIFVQKPEWDAIGRVPVANHWVYHFQRGGIKDPADRSLSDLQANQIFNAGVAADVLRKASASGPPRYTLNRSHPAVEKSHQAAIQVVRAFDERFGVREVEEGPLLEHLALNPWTDSEARFWLGAMAAERNLTWRQRKVVINNTPLVRSLRSELSAQPKRR